MMSTDRFLDLLQEKELMSPRAVASLRAQIAESPKPTTSEAVARRLIKHGHLTLAQAKRLLATDHETQPTARPVVKPKPTQDDSDLGFAPLEGESEVKSRAKEKKKPASTPRTEKPAAKPQAAKPDAKPQAAAPQAAKPRAAKRDSLLDMEMPASGGGLDAAPAGRLDLMSSDAESLAGESASSPLAGRTRGRGFLSIFARKPKERKKKSEEEKWGGSLMLMGGGGLLFLLIAVGFLLYSIWRGDAEGTFKLADDDYRGGSYLQAIHKYQDYLAKYNERASLARVRIGVCEMRQATQTAQGDGDWSTALKTAQNVLKKLTVEEDFKEAHTELAAMLPQIGEGLAAEARKKTDATLVEEAKQTVALTEKLVPRNLRQESKLKDISDSLAITTREIARGDELNKTIAAMNAAVKKLKTKEAYAACAALVHQYPDLADHAQLKKAVLAVSQAQQALVKNVSEKKPAADAKDASTAHGVTLAQRDVKASAPDVEGQIVMAAVDGAVYGLDAANGKLLWRRFVGLSADPRAPSFGPTPLTSEPGADALVVDSARNELLRIEGTTGRVRWRHAVGEAFDAHPVVAGENVYVATPSGKLITVAAPSGDSPGYVQFPQLLNVAPAVDTKESLLYQVADHTNIFVLSLADGMCKHVAYLGHEPGSIVAAPVVVEDYLLVAVNDGARDCMVQVLAIQPKRTDKPEPWLKPVEQVRLEGHVLTTPLVDGRRVLVTTTTGDVRVFEVSATDAKKPLREVAQTAIEGKAGTAVRFALMQGGQFWIADNRLTKYDVQAARGRLMPKWLVDQDSAYLQPPVAVGQTVVSVRRELGRPGAVVSSVAMQDPDKYWETRIAAPPAGEPVVLADGKVCAVTANGAVFRLDMTGEKSVADEPILAPDAFRVTQAIVHVVPLADGLLAISPGKGSDQIGVFEPQNSSPLMYWLKVPEKLACAPSALGKGVLAAGKTGMVFLLDPRTGDPLAEPFQPRLETGVEFDWITPVPIGGKEVVLVDGKSKKLYRVGVKAEPQSHLVALAEALVTKSVVGPLAVLGDSVFLGDTAGGLTTFHLPALGHGDDLSVGSRCAWGPTRVGDAILLATDDNNLVCIDAKGKRLWQAAMEFGPLAGALRMGDHYVFASRSGIVWRADSAGKTLGKTDVGCPLASGPVARGKQLIVAGHDGTLYEVREP